MASKWLSVLLVFTLSTLLLAGCSKRARHGEVQMSPRVIISVNNNLNPPSPFSLYVISDNGTRQLLGTIPAGATRSVPYRPLASTARFRLVARIAGGPDIASQTFSLTDVAVVSWNAKLNAITFTDQP